MTSIKSIIIATFVLFVAIHSSVFATERSWLDEPIKFNPERVTDSEGAILESMEQRGWQLKAKTPTMITAWLNNYKDHQLILEITHENGQISFNQVSFKKVGCTNPKICKANTKLSDRWRLYLRKNIAMNIHKRAMDDLLKTESIRNEWVEKIRTGSPANKVQLARNMIDIEYFNTYAMAEMESEIKANYQRKKLSSDEVQYYAYFCKVLARSEQDKYKALLTQVSTGAQSKKLRRYVKGYIAKMEK